MVASVGAAAVASLPAALGCADVSGAEDPESPHPKKITAADIVKVMFLIVLLFAIISGVLP
jgi:hypothetical protein